MNPTWVMPLLLGFLLCGCCKTQPDKPPAATETTVPDTTAASSTAVQTSVPPPAPTESAPPVAEPEAVPVLPMLSITTKRQDKYALDFAEKPVTPYIAEEAAGRLLDLRSYPAPFYEACTVTLTDTDNSICLEQAEADVRVRGNWTTYYDKKPLRIRFTEKQPMLSLHDGISAKNWVLLAEYKDPSYLRNRTALAFSRELLAPDGLYAADAALVEVSINGQYWGVYLLTEQQEVDTHRIPLTKPEPDSTDTRIGYLIEYDGYSVHEDPLQQFAISFADNAPLTPYDGSGGGDSVIYPLRHGWYDPKQNVGFSIKSSITSQAQHDFIAGWLDNVYRILYAAAYEKRALRFSADLTALEPADISPQEAVEQVIDVQSLVDIYILSELVCDADLNWSSFFMDVDFGEGGSGKLRFEAPWDFDSAMGIKERCPDGTGFYAANLIPDLNDEYYTINPWLAVLAYEDWFQARVRRTWSDAWDDGVFDRVIASVHEDSVQYADAFERDAARWKKKSPSLLKADDPPPSQMDAADALSAWLHTRTAFLNDRWYEAPEETTETPAVTESPESAETA